MKKYNNSTSLSSGLNITTKSPADDRVYFNDVSEAEIHIIDNGGAKSMHDGIIIMITNKPLGANTEDNYSEYVWMETSEGLFDTPYTYPSWQGEYTGKIYNLVIKNSSTVVRRLVAQGTSSIIIGERYLPLEVRKTKIANIVLYEGGSQSNPDNMEQVFPNSVEISTNGITQETSLIIHVLPAYDIDTIVTIKIT